MINSKEKVLNNVSMSLKYEYVFNQTGNQGCKLKQQFPCIGENYMAENIQYFGRCGNGHHSADWIENCKMLFWERGQESGAVI